MCIHINDSPRLDLYRSNTYPLIDVGVSHEDVLVTHHSPSL